MPRRKSSTMKQEEAPKPSPADIIRKAKEDATRKVAKGRKRGR